MKEVRIITTTKRTTSVWGNTEITKAYKVQTKWWKFWITTLKTSNEWRAIEAAQNLKEEGNELKWRDG